MKAIIFVCLLVLVLIPSVLAGDKSPGKFDVEFKVKYQNKTLSEIAVLETLIQQRNKDACVAKIKEIKEVAEYGFLTGFSSTYAPTSPAIDIADYPIVDIDPQRMEITIRGKGDYKIVDN